MNLALGIARGLGAVSALPSSLESVERRAELINAIDGTFVAGPDALQLGEQIGTRIAEIVARSLDFIPDVTDPIERLKIVLRLWAGCLDAAKMIAPRTNDGPNTPEGRAQAFLDIDALAQIDEIYRAGVEASPAFKRLRNDSYSLDGVPAGSSVRRYA